MLCTVPSGRRSWASRTPRRHAHKLGGFHFPPDPDDDVADESLRAVWQEVGGDLRGAMKQYPLEQAAIDAGRSLSPSTA